MNKTSNKTSKPASKTTSKTAKSAAGQKAASSATAGKQAQAKAETPKASATAATGSKNPFEAVTPKLTSNLNKLVEQVRTEASKAESMATKMTADVNAGIETAMVEAATAARDFTYTAVGAPFAFQAVVAAGNLAEASAYATFFEDAKAAGAAQLADLQKKVDPYVKQIAERVEPIVGQFESMFPSQVQEALASNRDRVRKLVNA